MSGAAGCACAIACANIALAKYWGKSNVARNLPAVPSLSLTLDRLHTNTSVEFIRARQSDEVSLDGQQLTGRPLQRVAKLLDQVRQRAKIDSRARVRTRNSFPTASGLASSASGFAALTLAATRAAGLELESCELSALARGASASAARSLYGGFVALPAGGLCAEPVAPPEHWQVSMLIAVLSLEQKSTDSTDAMLHTAERSPYYPAWVAHAPHVYDQVRSAVLARDLEQLGSAMEHSALMMHACMLASRPATSYFTPATWALLGRIRELRDRGTPAYFTMDAGPHVKVLTERTYETTLRQALEQIPEVVQLLVCHPGPDAHLTTEQPQP